MPSKLGDQSCILTANSEIEKLVSVGEPERNKTMIVDAVEGKDSDRRMDDKKLDENEMEFEVCQKTETMEENSLCIFIRSEVTQVGRNIVIKSNEADESNGGIKAYNNNKVTSKIEDKPHDWINSSSGESTSSDIAIQRKRPKKLESHKLSQAKIKVFHLIGPPDPSQPIKQFFEKSDDVMKVLQVLRDNGQWALFEQATNDMTQKYRDDVEASLIISLERSMAMCYQNKLEDCVKMIRSVIDKSENTQNSLSLKRRAYLYLSGVYRKMGDQTGNAHKHTELAEKIDGEILTLDLTFTHYERASVLMDFMAKCPGHKPNIKERAKASLKKCIDDSLRLEKDTSQKRYIKKHQFAFIKIAMLVLECRTAAGRNKNVSQSDINEAEDCLSALRKYWNGMAQGEKVQYYLAMADLNWRKQDFEEAQRSASTALKMAEEFGFVTEIKPARDRLVEIQSKLQDIPLESTPVVECSVPTVRGSDASEYSPAFQPKIRDIYSASTSGDESASEFGGALTDSNFAGSSSCETDDSLSLPLL